MGLVPASAAVLTGHESRLDLYVVVRDRTAVAGADRVLAFGREFLARLRGAA